jgi:hypothetical protein
LNALDKHTLNGTQMARPVRTTATPAWRLRHQLADG